MTCKNVTSPAMIPTFAQLLTAGSTLIECAVLLPWVSWEPSQSSVLQKGHVSSLTPAKTDLVGLHLELQLYLILTPGPGNSPQKKAWISPASG